MFVHHLFSVDHLDTFIVYAFYGFSYLYDSCDIILYFFRFASDLNQGIEFEPEFLGSISNVTYPAGREAVLTCSVKNLGKYKVSVVTNHTEYILFYFVLNTNKGSITSIDMLPMLSNEITFVIQRVMVLFNVMFGNVVQTTILCAVCKLAKHTHRNLVIPVIMISTGV